MLIFVKYKFTTLSHRQGCIINNIVINPQYKTEERGKKYFFLFK